MATFELLSCTRNMCPCDPPTVENVQLHSSALMARPTAVGFKSCIVLPSASIVILACTHTQPSNAVCVPRAISIIENRTQLSSRPLFGCESQNQPGLDCLLGRMFTAQWQQLSTAVNQSVSRQCQGGIAIIGPASVGKKVLILPHEYRYLFKLMEMVWNSPWCGFPLSFQSLLRAVAHALRLPVHTASAASIHSNSENHAALSDMKLVSLTHPSACARVFLVQALQVHSNYCAAPHPAPASFALWVTTWLFRVKRTDSLSL